MKNKVGLWIDQKKAVVVSISDKGVEMRTLISNIEKFFQPSSGEHYNIDYGRKDFPAFDIIERDMEMHIQKFCDKVISRLCNAGSIFIFGPGQVKTVLQKRIAANHFLTRNVKVEAADKMTDTEILEKVRHTFPARSIETIAYGKYMQPVGS